MQAEIPYFVLPWTLRVSRPLMKQSEYEVTERMRKVSWPYNRCRRDSYACAHYMLRYSKPKIISTQRESHRVNEVCIPELPLRYPILFTCACYFVRRPQPNFPRHGSMASFPGTNSNFKLKVQTPNTNCSKNDYYLYLISTK